MSLSLLAFLLHLTRKPTRITFNGRPLSSFILPAGFTFLSPFLASCFHLQHFFDRACVEKDVLTDENPLYYSSPPDEPSF